MLIAEGDTERAARPHLKLFLDAQAGALPKVRLEIVVLDGGLTERLVRSLATEFLLDSSVVGVIALTDLYPKFPDAASARSMIASWMPGDTRCHVAVAKHDFEAWLLVGWDAILSQARVGKKQQWGANPEDVNHNHPPAHRMQKLFDTGPRSRRYKKPVDGKKLFERLDLLEVAKRCPEFKLFLNCMLQCAAYPLLP